MQELEELSAAVSAIWELALRLCDTPVSTICQAARPANAEWTCNLHSCIPLSDLGSKLVETLIEQ